MLKKRLLGFVVGGIFSLFYVTIKFSIDETNREDIFWAVGYIAILLSLYYAGERYLLDYKWFRRLIAPKMTPYEGYWAEKLEGTKYDISLGRISYDPHFDYYVYEGWAFTKLSSNEDKAQWRSRTFIFDEEYGQFHFTCDSFESLEGSDKRRYKLESVGYLRPTGAGTMSGTAIDMGSKLTPVDFNLRLFKVTKKDIRSAIGKKRDPETGREKLAIIKNTLQRVGELDEKQIAE